MTPTPFLNALHQVVSKRNLSVAEMKVAMGAIMDGDAEPIHMAAFLSALCVKGETDSEVLGAVEAMRDRAETIRPAASEILDTCGTGGDGSGTFNISTAVAFVCSAAGKTVAKHGNRAVSSNVGSADVLEALGVRIDLTPESVTRCVDDIGLGFLFAPQHHSALRHAAPVRRALGFRTVLNLLGPMTNPAFATHQLIGVFALDRLRQVATVLSRLGSKRALIVHGEDGLDEISIASPTYCALWDGSTVRDVTITPEGLGIERSSLSTVAGGDAHKNAEMIRAALNAQDEASFDIVRLNAAAALWVAQAAPSMQESVELATDTIRTGLAQKKLDELIAMTQDLAP
jgi:anthranilate phosphoribosyltransferase